jgi:Activator of Hsp90 ATPase homolog 1-like protein
MENRQCLRIETQSHWYRYEEKPMATTQPIFNSLLDLKLERIIDVPPSTVWRAYTEPELLKKWFCLTPWKTIDAELDVRPGGIFQTIRCSASSSLRSPIKFAHIPPYLVRHLE